MTPEQYQQKKALLADPNKSFSPEARAKVQAALDEFEQGGGLEHTAPEQQSPEQNLVSQLNPGFALLPQALAVQPATTHPEGDQAAADEWLRGPLDNPAGRVIVYDAPMTQVRKDLAENPTMLDALGLSISPGSGVQKGDAVEQAYQDFKWRQAADAAAKAGKTAYRAAKAPYLTSGPNASLLDTLSTKVKSATLPGIETLTAFVLGYDKTADFGLANAASNSGLLDDEAPKLTPEEQASGKWALHPTLGKVPKEWMEKNAPAVGTSIGGGKDEVTGGATKAAQDSGMTTRQQNDMLAEENPTAHVGGEVLGAAPGLLKLPVRGAAAVGRLGGATAEKATGAAAQAAERGIDGLAQWNPANSLWEAIVGAPTATEGLVKPVVSAAARGAAAAGVSQGVDEAAQAGANYAKTGDTGTTFGAAAGRVGDAALGGAVLSGLLQGVPESFGNFVREGKRYEGLPGELERLGADVRVGRGHVEPPAVTEARQEAKARPLATKPIDVLAEKLDEPLATAARSHVGAVNRGVKERKAAFMATPEGQQPLPERNVVETSLAELRQRTSKAGSKTPSPVGTPGADRPVKGIFNTNLEGVSTKPVDGALELTPEEAESFLSPVWRKRALRSIESKKPVKRPGAEPGAAMDFEKGPGAKKETGAEWRASIAEGSFAKALRKAKVESVWVMPRRYDAEHAETAIAELRHKGADTKKNRDLNEIYKAALRDRDTRSLDGEPGGWSKLQGEHSKQIGAAKDTLKRVAPDKGAGAYQAVIGIGNHAAGQSKTLAALQETANRAGGRAPEQLRAARAIQPFDRLAGHASLGRTVNGTPRGLMGLTAPVDMALLKGVYPVTRQLEAARGLGRGSEMGLLARATGEESAREERTKARDEKTRAAAPQEPEKPKGKYRPRRIRRSQPRERETQ